jgi:hypothetical protein
MCVTGYHGPVSAHWVQKGPDFSDIPPDSWGGGRISYGRKVCLSRKPNTASNKSWNDTPECKMPCEYFQPAALASFDI